MPDSNQAEAERSAAACQLPRSGECDLDPVPGTTCRYQVPHIRHCLDLLTRRSEGGVELDRAASEASGIDYDRLVLLLRSRHTDADDRFAGPKVPRKAAAGTTTNLSAGESPQAPVGPIRSAPWQPDPESLSGDPRAHDRELIPESVGHQINRYREECRKTIEDLAEEMEISTRAVQRHIKDDCMPLARVLTGYERIFSKYLNKQIVIKKMS